ncbi:MAG: hypothetical protein ACMXYM_02545 [Candidatus Woesearchaeota archaeon]
MKIVILAIATLMLAACAAELEAEPQSTPDQTEEQAPIIDFEDLEEDLDALALALEDLDLTEEELEYQEVELD